MKSFNYKKDQDKNRSVATDSSSKNSTENSNDFEDNSAEAIQMRQLQANIDESEEVKQMKSYQDATDKHETIQGPNDNPSDSNNKPVDQNATSNTAQLSKEDMSPSLQDMDDINAIDKQAHDKAMDVTKEEYLTKQMSLLVGSVREYSAAMDMVSKEGASVLELNDRLQKLVLAGAAISALSIGLTIATGGAAAPAALLIGLSTQIPGLAITLGKSVTKKQRDKKKKDLGDKAENRAKDNAQDVVEQVSGIGAGATEAVGDYNDLAEGAEVTVEAGAEIAGMSLAGISILLGVKDIYYAQKISLAKILGPKFFNEQMVNLSSLRATMDNLDSKGGQFPIKSQLSPHIDLIQSSIERIGDR
ncbi:MAG: hypothetical protein MK207_09155 [Saprospiraceae bacterium]|nr:hypothetical protein [Saprospiraceae bacterium]